MSEEKKSIFSQEEFDQIQRASRQIAIVPFITMAISAGLIIAYRKINFTKILPNPLGKPKVQQYTKLSDVTGTATKKKLFIHTIFMIGFGSAIGAFVSKQFTLLNIFNKHQKEVQFYTRWKIEQELKAQNII